MEAVIKSLLLLQGGNIDLSEIKPEMGYHL